MKKTDLYVVLFAFIIITIAVAAVLSVRNNQSHQQVKSAPAITPYQKTSPTLIPVPAYQSPDNIANLMPTLSPEVFDGSARAAYTVAREIPQTLAQLPCYCHCDKNLKHKSLHSCFVDDHGAKCGICMNEALQAYKLQKEQKLTPEQIRQKIIKDFSAQY